MKISDKDHVERTALLWESLGLSEEAAHIRKHGICLATGRPANPETIEKLKRYVEVRRFFRKQRETTPRKEALEQCCEKFKLFIEYGADVGKPDLTLASRIVDGRVPGVAKVERDMDA